MTAAPLLLSAPRRAGWRSWINPSYLPLFATLLVLVTLFVGGGLKYERLLSAKTFVDLLGDNSFLGIAAIGATIVILSGGIDLSIGAVVAFSTILMASLVHPTAAAQLAADPTLDLTTLVGGAGLHPLVAAAITLAIGAAFGSLLGTLIALYELPPFMVTLSGMFFARSMGYVVHEASLGIDHAFYSDTLPKLALHITDVAGRRGRPLPVSLQPTAMLMLGLFVVAVGLLHYTPLGRNVYAIGGDEASAKLLGVRVGRTKILVYTLAGFCSALAGVVATIYKGSGDPASFVGLELDAIAAVVIGGTLLTGGRGFVVGTLLGTLLLGLIQTFINFNGNLRTEWARIFVGALMLAFILLQGGFNKLGRWFRGSVVRP